MTAGAVAVMADRRSLYVGGPLDAAKETHESVAYDKTGGDGEEAKTVKMVGLQVHYVLISKVGGRGPRTGDSEVERSGI